MIILKKNQLYSPFKFLNSNKYIQIVFRAYLVFFCKYNQNSPKVSIFLLFILSIIKNSN